MSESTLRQLRVLVERAVRPVRASGCRKRQMREDLLAHVTAVFEEEVARLASEPAALERTAQRFGNPADLTGQLQDSVPALDSIDHLVERLVDWVFFRPGESTLRRAVRYTLLTEAVAVLFLVAVLLLVRGVVGELPTAALWHTCPVLLLSGYLGCTLCLLESSLGRLLEEQRRGSWLRLALVLAGSTTVSLALGFWAFGVSTKNTVWVPVFTVGAPVELAWALAHGFAARKRYHEDWTSLQIE